MVKRQSIEDRFWPKVDKDGPVPGHMPHLGQCWVWTASKLDSGYGQFGIGGKLRYAHRQSWEMERGEIPGNLCVLHSCDNPSCVRPEHLFLGTRRENSSDYQRKGRLARGDAHGSRTHPERLARGDANGARTRPECLARGDAHGSKTRPERVARGDRHMSRTHPERVAHGDTHGNAKLTAEKVREIRRRCAAGEIGKDVGRLFGVTQAAISAVVTRRTWGHVR